ncbi:PHB depolymerase family esterase [uncultured Draconibacterium sp.]|uniref:alpha/beta hydrolase family esterase n=1 Tax=uncultured Draconibacterium sp. TaxID=1573823 RepID=UPI0032170B50
MKIGFLVILGILLSEFSKAQLKTEAEYISVDGMERYYELYVPSNYSQIETLPIVFVLHGGGGKASGMTRFTRGRFNELADRDGFIVVYPNGYQKSWNDGERDTLAAARRLNIDDVGFFESMIDDLDTKFSIDRKNIFACGISNGGFMVQRLAIERSGLFKALGVVAANMSEDQQKSEPMNPVSAIFICGTADPLVPYNGGPVKVLQQVRGEVLSMEETLAYWKRVNFCTTKMEVVVYPDINKRDRSNVVKTVWQNPSNEQIKVVDIRVENGGHTWPGGTQYLPRGMVGTTNRDFNACDEIWTFFKSLI